MLFSFFRFAFPALSLPPEISVSGQPKKLSETFTSENRLSLAEAYLNWKKENPLDSSFFVVSFGSIVRINHLEAGFSSSGESDDFVFGFADPSTNDSFPGWPLRNLLCLVASKFNRRRLCSKPLKIICLRQKSTPGGKISVDDSIVIDVVCSGGSETLNVDEPLIKGRK